VRFQKVIHIQEIVPPSSLLSESAASRSFDCIVNRYLRCWIGTKSPKLHPELAGPESPNFVSWRVKFSGVDHFGRSIGGHGERHWLHDFPLGIHRNNAHILHVENLSPPKLDVDLAGD
jgi:hypothetical protein